MTGLFYPPLLRMFGITILFAMKPLYRMFYGLTISLTGPDMAQLKEGKGLQ
ncbi:hypothetical protein U0070_002680 [Myodes glareolus]|uniref:Uncharacterized protein n=1 Tax=Myodes glareolus TaxID=447135 RepID=A0AAW0HP37_MYOGA